jgi:hypothetical protein
MEGFFTKRICFASLWITQFCRAAESPSDTEFLDGPPLKKSKNGEILALSSVGDFPIDANRSVAEGLPELQVSCSDGRSGARHVDPFCGRPKVFERLLEILNDFADWLGLRAHTLLSLGPQSKIVMGEMVAASPWSAQQHYAYSFHQACYPAIPIIIRRLF